MSSSSTSCPKCGTTNGDGAAFCQNCGNSLQSTAVSARIQSSPRERDLLANFGLAPITLILLVLIIIEAILSFLNASDFSEFSFTSATGVFSAPLWPIFALFGIVELAAAYGIFRKQKWGTIGAAFLAFEGLAFAPGQTIVSILIILILLYLNRNSLSFLAQQQRLS